MRFFSAMAVYMAVLCFCVGTLDSTYALAAPQDAVPEAESFVLDNGLQVVVCPKRRVPIVGHTIWYKVGAADEAPGQSGIAHFFEHLMFKATANHEAGELDAAVKAVGGSLNAFTSADYTAYYEQVPPEALGEMMAFEADRMRNLILDEQTIETERRVVIEERLGRVENQPSGILDEASNATLFQNHPYGTPIIGWMHEIKQLDRQQLLDFYKRHYTPNNAILVVSGDVDVETARRLAEETYGKVPRGPDLPPRIRPVEPEARAMRSVSLKDPRVSLPHFARSWVTPAYFPNDPASEERRAAEALFILAEILGGGAHSRLYRELVVERQIASSISAWVEINLRDYALFGVNASPISEGEIKEVEAAVAAEIEKIARSGVTESELDTAKKALASKAVFAREDHMSRAIELGTILAIGGTVEDFATMTERIQEVPAGDIQSAARQYLALDRSMASYLLPDGEMTE